jgi:hypothetical protein
METTNDMEEQPLKLRRTVVDPEDQIDEYINRFKNSLNSISDDMVKKTITLIYNLMGKLRGDINSGTCIIERSIPITSKIDSMTFKIFEPVTEKTQNSYLDTNTVRFESEILQNEASNIILKKYILEDYNYANVYLIALHEITMQIVCSILKNLSKIDDFNKIIIPKIYKVTKETDGTRTYINIYMEKLIVAIPKETIKDNIVRFYDTFNDIIKDFFQFLGKQGIHHLDTKYQNMFFINYNGSDAVAVIDFGTARVYPVDSIMPGADDGYYSNMNVTDFSNWIDGKSQRSFRTFGGLKTKKRNYIKISKKRGSKRVSSKKRGSKKRGSKRGKY